MDFFRDVIGVKYPVIQGGMANIATGAFAAACSNAGALGMIASGGMDAEGLEKEIHICKKMTDKPFGVNLMLMNRHMPELAEIVVREGVKVLTTGAGSPAAYMDMWKGAGITVIPVSSSVLLAARLVKAGADAVIAEGTEAGGHVGEMTTMTLVPQMSDALDVPVIAAGGIADKRQVNAAFALGAVGVQVGTCLLVSEECPIHDNYKQQILKARDNSTTVTGRISGTPVRLIKNRMAREYLEMEAKGADKEELERYTLGSLKKAVFEGDVTYGSLMAGQVCGQLKEIRPVEEIIRELVS